MGKNLFGVEAQGGEIVCAELFGGGGVVWGKGVGVRILAREVGDGAGLGGVQVELEPLVTLAEVVDLEAPAALGSLVAEFAGV